VGVAHTGSISVRKKGGGHGLGSYCWKARNHTQFRDHGHTRMTSRGGLFDYTIRNSLIQAFVPLRPLPLTHTFQNSRKKINCKKSRDNNKGNASNTPERKKWKERKGKKETRILFHLI
jgi:hypothetical protein